jgi:uncharacterized protein DUF3108
LVFGSHISKISKLTLACMITLAARPSLGQTVAHAASVNSLPASQILPPSPSYRFPSGEKLVYSVQWRMFHAGISTVSINRSDGDQRVTATADSAGMPDKFFRIHDTFNADLDPRNFCTLQISKHNEEGSRRLDRNIHFDYPRAKSQVDDKDLKTGKDKHAEFDIPPCVSDVISGFFYTRSLPLEPGFSRVFPVNDGGKTTDVKIEVECRETIKGPTGEFHTLRVKAEPISGPMTGKGELLVWFTDDGRHVPVQMKSKLGFATLLFQLQKIDPPTQ